MRNMWSIDIVQKEGRKYKIMGMNMKKANVLKKIALFILTVCLVVPSATMLTYAANGQIMFTDPSTKAGEVVEVRGVLEADDAIEDRTIVMSYDTSMLKFQSGESVTENSAGQLTYSVSGVQEDDGRVEFTMSFEALKEGTAKIEVESYKAWTAGADYEPIDCTKGSSTITIAAGEIPNDEPNDEPVDVPGDTPGQLGEIVINGVTYTLSGEFVQTKIPEGFEQTTIEYAGENCNVVFSNKYGIYLGYLVNPSGEGEFFVYSQEDATFAPYAEIAISDITSIILLNNVEGITLPEPYMVTTVLVNGVDFPAWQNTEKPESCILYAVNTNGQKSLYQLDSSEGTYQKFEAPEVIKEETDDSFIGKLSEALQEHLDKFILGTGIGFIVLLVIIIVLAVKLFNRNAELDEIYDEYGIMDFEDEEEDNVAAQKSKKKVSFEEDDDMKIVETKPEKAVNNSLVKPEEEKVKNVEVDEAEADEFTIDLSSILEEEKDEKSDVQVKNTKTEETLSEDNFYDDDDEDLDYEMDFIDLDD